MSRDENGCGGVFTWQHFRRQLSETLMVRLARCCTWTLQHGARVCICCFLAARVCTLPQACCPASLPAIRTLLPCVQEYGYLKCLLAEPASLGMQGLERGSVLPALAAGAPGWTSG